MNTIAARLTCGITLLFLACGYHSMNPPRTGPRQGFCVESGPEPAPHPQASPSVLFGARDALARNAQLADCPGEESLVIQVVNVNFESDHVVSDGSATARSTRVRVTATGHTSGRTSGSGPKDLGIVVEEAVVATGATPMAEQHAHTIGVVAASRRAGDALVRRLLGEPLPTPSPQDALQP